MTQKRNNSFRRWFEAIRAPFLIAVVVPALLGHAIAFSHGYFDGWLFALVLGGLLCAHAGSNLANDYFDYKSGCDINNKNVTPFSGGSEVLPKGILTPKQVLLASLLLFSAAFLVSIYLTMVVGMLIIVFSVIGAVSGFCYTESRINIASRGLGELLIGMNFGVLIVLGAYYVQTGSLALGPIVASIPIAMLIAAVIYINEFPDYDADKSAGKRNLVVRLGQKRAIKYFPLFFVVVYGVMLGGAITTILPVGTLIALLSLPLSVKIIKIAKLNYMDTKGLIPAMGLTIMDFTLTGLLLSLGYVL